MLRNQSSLEFCIPLFFKSALSWSDSLCTWSVTTGPSDFCVHRVYLALYILIMLILSKYLLIIFDMVADMDKYFAEDFTHSTPHCWFSKGVR
jgi:hypothetical protein